MYVYVRCLLQVLWLVPQAARVLLSLSLGGYLPVPLSNFLQRHNAHTNIHYSLTDNSTSIIFATYTPDYHIIQQCCSLSIYHDPVVSSVATLAATIQPTLLLAIRSSYPLY